MNSSQLLVFGLWIKRVGLALAVLIAALTLYGETAKRVSLRLRAVDSKGKVVGEKIALSGAILRLTANIPRASENRWLATAIECDAYFRSWQERLDGERAPYSRESNVGPMPAGYCMVGVTVFWADAKAKSGISQQTALQPFCFMGGDEHCQ